MRRAYSEDLRLQVVKALDDGMSKMTAHRFFGISRSTIDDWLALRERTGSVVDKPSRRGRVGALSDAKALAAFVEAHPERTLAEMATAWHQAGGPLLSRLTFSIGLRRLGYTRKKSVCAFVSDASLDALSGSNASRSSPPRIVYTWTRPGSTTP